VAEEGRGGQALGCFNLVGSLLLLLISLATIAIVLPDVGFTIYFVRQVGWIALVVGAVSFLGAFFILLLGFWVDKLKSGALVGFYTAVPGVLAGVIQIGLTNPQLVPH
jgi:hypothetical protein